MEDIDSYESDNVPDPPEPFVDEDWDLEPEYDPGSARHDTPATDRAIEAQHKAIRAVCECLKEQKLALDEFLDGLCYGNQLSVADTLTKECRRQLIQSPRLSTILNNLRSPSHYTGARPKAATVALDRWAWNQAIRQARGELAQLTRQAQKEDTGTYGHLNLEDLNINTLTAKAQSHTPRLLRFLTLVGETKNKSRTQRKSGDLDEDIDPTFAAVFNTHALAFLYAPQCNTSQKLLSLYFRAKHAPKALFSLFNRCGFVMSYSWSLGAIRQLSTSALERMREAVEGGAIFWIYDNLRLPSPIKSQRGDRHTVTNNGTAMTVVELPDHIKHIFMKSEGISDNTGTPEHGSLPPDVAKLPPALSWDDFLDFDRLERLTKYDIHSLIVILFETVPGLEDSEHLSSAFLQLPKPQHIMPSGDEHKTRYHMLGTVPIDEGSVGGNLQVIYEMLAQQGLDTDTNQKILGSGECIIPVVGDQMTVDRISALKSLRVHDPNGYERLSFLVTVPGWFHVLLNLGMTTFDAFQGGDKTMSFARDVALLGRTGFTMNMRKKRPDFHTNDEFLRHKLFALVRSLWMHYSRCDNIEKLISWVKSSTPQLLQSMAQRIYLERVASSALEDLSNQTEPDQALCNTILQSRDLLQYYSTRTAIQSGNVGWLEDLLPNLVIYFKGRENYHYAQSLADTMRWMRHETSPELSNAIRNHVWLVNTSGRPKGFYEADRLQEFNNGKQKQFGPPPQTTSWETHKEISPAIPILGEIAKHVEDHIFDFQHTQVHKATPMELDISRLASRHLNANLHKYQPERKLEDENDIAVDYFKKGTQSLIDTQWLANLAIAQDKYRKLQSVEQVYVHGTETIPGLPQVGLGPELEIRNQPNEK